MSWFSVPQARTAEVTVLAFGLEGIVPGGGDLSETERQRADEQATAALSARYRAAHAVLRSALAAATGATTGRLEIIADRHGKPWLADHPRWHFNLSHSGSQAMVAIGSVPLGVDLEAQTARHSDNEALARWVLDDASFARWLQGGAADRAEQLCRAWTFKEAYLKAHGTGLGSEPLKALLPPSGGRGPIAPGPDGAPPWWVRPLPAPWGFHAALCTQGLSPPVRLFRLDAGGWAELPDPGRA
jgi:4'-phosphopantetheinyl transferase